MLAKILIYTIGSTLGLYVSTHYVTKVAYTGDWKVLAFTGFAIALLNLAIAPVLKVLSLPLRILTFNLFSLVIDMSMVAIADILTPELQIQGLFPLFVTTLIIMIVNSILWTILSQSLKS